MPAPGAGPLTAPSSRRAPSRPSAEVTTFFLGSWRIAVARGWRARADHKFLIVPQCTLSAGISLCGICAKSEQLLAILPVFTALPQLRHVAALNAVGARAVTSRTGTARSTTNTQSVREHFSRDGVLGSSLAEWIRKVPVKGRESVNEHGLRVIGRRAFIRVACGDQAVAHRAAAGRAGAARPGLGQRAQVARR